MTADRIETFRARQLRRELLRLREAAGKSTEDVATELYWSKGKISRIETGKSRVSPSDVRLLCDVYGVDEPARGKLIRLGREARERGWWEAFSDVFTGSHIALEAEAATMRVYEAHLVPGVLRTEGYLRALSRAERPSPTREVVDRRVAALVARQTRLLAGDIPAMTVILDEAVIRRPVGGPEVMRAQLRLIAEIGALQNVSIHILPFTTGAYPTRPVSFTLLGASEPTALTVVHIEHLSGELYLDDERDVAIYAAAFEHVQEAATDPDDLERQLGVFTMPDA